MRSTVNPSLLLVGISAEMRATCDLDVYVATSFRETLATIRLIGVDLMLVGTEDPKLDVWELVPRVLTACPRQRWMLAAAEITAEEEILARSLGALLILAAVPQQEWLAEFAASLRQRELLKSVISSAGRTESGRNVLPMAS